MLARHTVSDTRLQWVVVVGVLALVLFVHTLPGDARVHVFIAPGLVLPFGPFWTPYGTPHAYPYGYPYAYPPVVVPPPPQVYTWPPPPPPVW